MKHVVPFAEMSVSTDKDDIRRKKKRQTNIPAQLGYRFMDLSPKYLSLQALFFQARAKLGDLGMLRVAAFEFFQSESRLLNLATRNKLRYVFCPLLRSH